MESSTEQTHAQDAAPPYETVPSESPHTIAAHTLPRENSDAMSISNTAQEDTSPHTTNVPSLTDIEVARVLGGLRSGIPPLGGNRRNRS